MSPAQTEFEEALARGDGDTLTASYVQAADEREEAGDIEAACFYLTQTYVHALDTGSSLAHVINRRLVKHGRETLLAD
jgi:hypothetical protein